MHFSALLQTIEREGGTARIEVSPEWMQGRAVFGGLQTILALAAMRGLVPETPLRTLQTTFIAPPSSNQVSAQATILRQGKSATHVEARLFDSEQNVLALVTGVFGLSRPSGVERLPERTAVDCETPRQYRYFPGKSPTFTQHFSARWLKGGMPFSQVKEPSIVVELDMPDETESTEAHVIAMADFLPPVALNYLRPPAPGSSLTWMLEFLSDNLNGLPMQGWREEAEMVAALDGYTSQSVMLWGPGGEPIAISRQSMVVFG